MQTNNHSISDYDLVLDKEFGAQGTKKRSIAEAKAYAFYSGQILQDARKDANLTQEQLAEKIDSSKSYISRIENGGITPSVGVFFRIVNALNMNVVLQAKN